MRKDTRVLESMVFLSPWERDDRPTNSKISGKQRKKIDVAQIP